MGDNGVGKSTLFRSILQFQKYKGRITWKGTVLKKKKSLYRDLTGVVQEAEKQFIRVSLREELQLDNLILKEISEFSKLYNILIWSRLLIRVPIN